MNETVTGLIGFVLGALVVFISLGWRMYELYASHDWICADCGRRLRGPTGPVGHLKKGSA